ncbi:MAG: hypothetical protein ABIJ34_03900 [archaeon]
MVRKIPVIKDEKRRVEKVKFDFKNPGEVTIEAPVINCDVTGRKFFHPDDAEQMFDELDKEYKRVHKVLKKD